MLIKLIVLYTICGLSWFPLNFFPNWEKVKEEQHIVPEEEKPAMIVTAIAMLLFSVTIWPLGIPGNIKDVFFRK